MALVVSSDHKKARRAKSKMTFVHEYDKWNPRRREWTKATKTVKAYHENSTDLRLPMCFGIGYLGGKHNGGHHHCPIEFTGKLRAHQVAVAAEATRALCTNGAVTLNLHTSFGKTVLSAYLACKLGMLTLVVYTSITGEKQWMNTLDAVTNAMVWVVGKKIPDLANVVLSTVGKLKRIPEGYMSKIGLLIIDESHTFCTEKRVVELLRVTPHNIIACTATVERSDGMEKIMHAMCGSSLIVRKNPRKPRLYVYRTGLSFDASDWERSLKMINRSRQRNNSLIKLIKANIDRKFLVLTWREKHGKLLARLLDRAHISNDWMIGSKKTYIDSKVLVGTVSKIGTGFDEKSFCESFNGVNIDVLVMMAGTKSELLSIQMAGRVMRSDNPKIVYYLDSSSTSRRHFRCFMDAIEVGRYKTLGDDMSMV